MKRFFLALALILSVTLAGAQPKTPEAAQKAIDKALDASKDAKKSQKVATWLTLGKAYTDAYDMPTNDIVRGTARSDMKLIIGKQVILETRDITIGDAAYTVDVYRDKELYYNDGGLLDFVIVTKPAIEGDLLQNAADAYFKGFEVDTKGAKKDEINIRLEGLHEKMTMEAYANYMTGNFAKAAEMYAKAAKLNARRDLKDETNFYYSGVMYSLAGDNSNAIATYNACIADGNYQEGNVFTNLSKIYLAEENNEMAKKVLEDGFALYPQSQGVLVGLINLYRSAGEDPQKLFDLLHAAQANEPGNASLYYVEGDVYKQLGDTENAEKYFRKSTEIDPTYVFGILSVGILYYDKAVELQVKANDENDDAKYNALMKEMEESLEMAIEPFEKSFEMTDDQEIKEAIAEYLKNIYFRLRDRGDDYMEKYNKYNDFLKK